MEKRGKSSLKQHLPCNLVLVGVIPDVDVSFLLDFLVVSGDGFVSTYTLVND